MKVSELAYNRYFKNKDVILFDLDNTIYEELEYLKHAYSHIAITIEQDFKIPQQDIYNFLVSEFQNKGRSQLFNKLIATFNLPDEYLPELLTLLREVNITQRLKSNETISDIISMCIGDKKNVFIVTNGNVVQQKNKIQNLDLADKLDNIKVIYANEHRPKPDISAFVYMKENFAISADSCIMVGDSPEDRQFATACGIDFVDVEEVIAC